MRHIPVVIGLLLALASPALAHGNVCVCEGRCSIGNGRGWTGPPSCRKSRGPDQGLARGDALVVAQGGTLKWDQPGTRTYRYLWIKPGGAVTVTASPVVMQFDDTVTVFTPVSSFFVVGDINDAGGTFTSDGKDLTISWVGTGSGMSMNLGPQPFGGQQDSTERYTSITMRGAERASTAVRTYSRGATAPTPDTDMVDCLDGIVRPVGGAPGDTIVFTSGRSQDYWYEVSCYPDRCTGPGAPFACCTAARATAECPDTACGGGACDYQITRNSTRSTPGSTAGSSSWNSMVKVAGNGGPAAFRHGTPDDSDADGTANGDGLLPAVDDTFTVFKPVLIQGRPNPITGGIMVHFNQAGIDWRYVEVNKASGQTAGDCAHGRGGTVFWDTEAKITSAEGAMEFVNLHNFASRQGAWEISLTDRPSDSRPNVPRSYAHIYIHDADPYIGAVCPAEGQARMASGITTYCDDVDGVIDGVTLDGLHVARWGDGAAFGPVDSCVTTNITARHLIIHDAPGIPGYGSSVIGLSLGATGTTTVDGASLWDLGNAGGQPASAIGRLGTAAGAGRKASDVNNAYIVNIDSGELAGPANEPGGGAVEMHYFDGTEDTEAHSFSNGYVANIIGHGGSGGRFLYNFIKNVVMEGDATAPCDDSVVRGALMSPVDVIGNVITRDHPLSCMENAILIGGGSRSTSTFTGRTRTILSNVLHGMFSDVAGRRTAGISVVDGASRSVDVYHNVIDGDDNTIDRTFGCDNTLAAPMAPYIFSAFYNVISGMPDVNGGGSAFEGFTADFLHEGFNRFIGLTQSPACNAPSCAASDVDSDEEDLYLDRANFRFGQRCDSPDRIRVSWDEPVGPLIFGIQDFSHFHPAVLSLMDAAAFEHYDWEECGGSARGRDQGLNR